MGGGSASAGQAQAERLADYFALQLTFARRMAALTGLPLAKAVARYTNFHKRLGLGDGGDDPRSADWLSFVEPLSALTSDAEQLAWTVQAFAARLPTPTSKDQTRFGCFACEAPDDQGCLRIHFQNREPGLDHGPLSSQRRAARMAELTAMFGYIRRTHPAARTVVGGSWLYNLEAYRRLFPPEYGASRQTPGGPVRLTGTSTWGQTLDFREAVKPAVRDHVLARLHDLDPAVPWLAFPLRALKAEAPVEAFYGMYSIP